MYQVNFKNVLPDGSPILKLYDNGYEYKNNDKNQR